MQSFNTAFSLGNVALSWNAIMLALGILTAVVVSGILVKKRKAYQDLALDACIVGIPSGLLGARLFSAISGKIPFSHFFLIGENGLNLPGALVFAGIAIAVYVRIKKLRVAETFDLLLPGAFFGLAVGRWSDFFLCEGLGPVVQNDAQKFFPLATFTPNYAQSGEVAYAVFFLDFLICIGLGILALFLSKKLETGRTTRLCVILYLFAAFLLEWLREGSARQLVFGGVRFNQIVWIVLLGFFIGLSLYRTKKPKQAGASKPEQPESEAPANEEDGGDAA
jgi:phosphatidylglycerol:prolipoprotein diacylglycerol transferase